MATGNMGTPGFAAHPTHAATPAHGKRRLDGPRGVPGWVTLLAIGAFAACGGDAGSSSGGANDATTGGASFTAETATPAETAAPAEFTVDPALLPEGVTVEMVMEGRELFNGAGICYTCHTVQATGGPLAPDLTDDVWLNVDGEYLSIIEVIKTGVAQPVEHAGAMLPRAGMPLTDEQVEKLAAYSYMLSRK